MTETMVVIQPHINQSNMRLRIVSKLIKMTEKMVVIQPHMNQSNMRLRKVTKSNVCPLIAHLFDTRWSQSYLTAWLAAVVLEALAALLMFAAFLGTSFLVSKEA